MKLKKVKERNILLFRDVFQNKNIKTVNVALFLEYSQKKQGVN